MIQNHVRKTADIPMPKFIYIKIYPEIQAPMNHNISLYLSMIQLSEAERSIYIIISQLSYINLNGVDEEKVTYLKRLSINHRNQIS